MRTQIVLSLDGDDARSVRAAMKLRENWNVMPDGESNREGALLAEICRGWMEYVELAGKRQDLNRD